MTGANFRGWLSSSLLAPVRLNVPRIALEVRRLKGLLKRAVAEGLESPRDLRREGVRERFEDLALTRAIPHGEKSPPVSRRRIFQRLERPA